MKRNLISAAALLLGTMLVSTPDAKAQSSLDRTHIGVIGGFRSTSTSYSNLDKAIFPSPSSVSGATFGIFAEFDLNDNLSLRPQLSFLSRGTDIEKVANARFVTPYGATTSSTPLDYTLKAQYTDLRVPVIYNFGEEGGIRPYLYIAPVLGLVRGGEISLAGSGFNYPVDISKANMASTYLALTPGVGVKFPVGSLTLGVEASYELGLTDTYGSKEKDGKAIANSLFPIYHIDGTRKFTGFEVSAHLSVPLSVFGGGGHHKPKVTSRTTTRVTPVPQTRQRLSDCYTLEEILRMLDRGKSVRGLTICAINQVNFATNKSTISSQSYGYLNKIVSLMKRTGTKIEICGHTDGTGSDEYNMELSRKRAEAVYNYLVLKGVSRSRLSYKYYGKRRPIDTNDTEQGRRNNRRVEFKLK